MKLTKAQTAKVKKMFPKHWKKIVKNMKGADAFEYDVPSRFLVFAFPWIFSPEGHDYWGKLHHELLTKEQSK